MSDITKCFGQDCPIKEKCYRFIAESEPLYQSYFVDVPGQWVPDPINEEMIFECEMFWGERADVTFDQLNKIFE